MGLEIKKVETSQHIRKFHDLPHRLYQGYPNWAPPFEFEVEAVFDAKKNIYFNYGECQRYLVLERDRVCGRFAVMHTKDKQNSEDRSSGGIGFIEMENDPSIFNQMLAFSKEWLSHRGINRMQGPVNFGSNDTFWGLLVQNFEEPPIYGMWYHPPYYKELIEATGPAKVDDHFSYKRRFDQPLPERLERIVDRVERNSKVQLRSMTPKTIEDDATFICDIYNKAWSEQDIRDREEEFEPMTTEAVRSMARKLKKVMMPESNYLVFVDNEPASFIASIPDLYELSKELKGRIRWWNIPRVMTFKNRATRLRTLAFGTVPRYRKLGVEALVFVRGIQNVKRAYPKLNALEGGWVSEKNWLMQRSLEALGMVHHKTHRTYEWSW